ncbi:MAG: hypothetical protein GWN11_03465 [Candidatus Dadabacteria bacterium]|nr:hypothetical protein [Candidatus Dadabacteria bacterium]NIX14950.1 hypothetical protein [Candidatus Dadabacteria bacterium]
MLFLVQAVMFFPAIFFVAGILFLIQKAIISLGSHDTIPFLVIFVIHLVVYFGIYYLVSVIAAKLISRIPSDNIKKVIIVSILLGLIILTQLSVYGAGRHSRMEWVTLAEFLADLNKLYGRFAAALVYGCTAVLIGSLLVFKRNRKTPKLETHPYYLICYLKYLL